MSLLAFKSSIASSDSWDKEVVLNRLEKIESARIGNWVYDKLKRKHPTLHTHLIISELQEYYEREASLFRFCAIVCAIAAFYSYVIGGITSTVCFSLAMCFALLGAFSCIQARKLILNTK